GLPAAPAQSQAPGGAGPANPVLPHHRRWRFLQRHHHAGPGRRRHPVLGASQCDCRVSPVSRRGNLRRTQGRLHRCQRAGSGSVDLRGLPRAAAHRRHQRSRRLLRLPDGLSKPRRPPMTDLIFRETPPAYRFLRGRRADQDALVDQLLVIAEHAGIPPAVAAEQAAVWITAIRADPRERQGLNALLREYDLATTEGVALMCLAEALLRVPDAGTAALLIRDKLAAPDWARHLGHS